MSLLKSFENGFKGLTVAFAEQRNLKIHSAIASVVVLLGFFLDLGAHDWIILTILIALVFSMELLNTAIENLTDLVTKEQHPLAGKVKDIAASAVLVISITSAIVGMFIFFKYV